MNSLNDISVCDIDKCSACRVCAAVCPVGCITFIPDALNNIHAFKGSGCIDCKRCEKVCPNLNISASEPIKKCFAGWSNDLKIRHASASGGVATELYRYEIESGGSIAGVKIEQYDAKYCLSDEINDLSQFQNSKYTLSDTVNIYAEIGEKIRCGKSITFVGLPCQVAALKNYLSLYNINTEKLLLIDLICHGVASPVYLKDHVKMIEKRKKRKAFKINFRDPRYKTFSYTFTLSDDKKTFYGKRVNRNDEYQIGYHNGICLRENCYSCNYATLNRQGDLTLADFGAVGSIKKTDYNNRNVSCILINTQKGEVRIKELFDFGKIFIDERPLEEATEHERQLKFPVMKNQYVASFRQQYSLNRNFDDAIRKSCKKIIIKNEIRFFFKLDFLKRAFSKIIPDFMKKFFRSVIGKR